MTCVNLEGATIHNRYKGDLKININNTKLLFRRSAANHSRFEVIRENKQKFLALEIAMPIWRGKLSDATARDATNETR